MSVEKDRPLRKTLLYIYIVKVILCFHKQVLTALHYRNQRAPEQRDSSDLMRRAYWLDTWERDDPQPTNYINSRQNQLVTLVSRAYGQLCLLRSLPEHEPRL